MAVREEAMQCCEPFFDFVLFLCQFWTLKNSEYVSVCTKMLTLTKVIFRFVSNFAYSFHNVVGTEFCNWFFEIVFFSILITFLDFEKIANIGVSSLNCSSALEL